MFYNDLGFVCMLHNVIYVRSELGYPSSNPERGLCISHSANTPGNQIIPLSALGSVVGLTWLFNPGGAIGQGKRKLRIQTRPGEGWLLLGYSCYMSNTPTTKPSYGNEPGSE